MSSIPKIALMIHNESLADLRNKVLRRAANIQKLTGNELTEFLKKLLDYGNKHYLRSYGLRLEME